MYQGAATCSCCLREGMTRTSIDRYLAGTQPEMVQEMPAGYVHTNGVVSSPLRPPGNTLHHSLTLASGITPSDPSRAR